MSNRGTIILSLIIGAGAIIIVSVTSMDLYNHLASATGRAEPAVSQIIFDNLVELADPAEVEEGKESEQILVIGDRVVLGSKLQAVISTPENVPRVVEEEFRKVYGQNPTKEESDHWKRLYRQRKWSRAELATSLRSTFEGRGEAATTAVDNQTQIKKSEPSSYQDNFNDISANYDWLDYLEEEAQKSGNQDNESAELDEQQSRLDDERRIRCAPIYDEIEVKFLELDNLEQTVRQHTQGLEINESQRQRMEDEERQALTQDYLRLAVEWDICMGF